MSTCVWVESWVAGKYCKGVKKSVLLLPAFERDETRKISCFGLSCGIFDMLSGVFYVYFFVNNETGFPTETFQCTNSRLTKRQKMQALLIITFFAWT